MQTHEFRPSNSREKAMWRFMLTTPKFRYLDVMNAARVSRHYMDIFAAKLRRNGLLKQVERNASGFFYTVMDQDAATAFARQQKGEVEGVMWTAIRSLLTFTPPEVVLVAGPSRPDVTNEVAHKYCLTLRKSKYLAEVGKSRKKTEPPRYRLINDTGPLPPIEKMVACVIDPNESRVVYAGGHRV